jgi:hypothetical protein
MGVGSSGYLSGSSANDLRKKFATANSIRLARQINANLYLPIQTASRIA